MEPRTEVHRLVYKTDGVIEKCLVEVGDFVQKGDLLLALDDREQRTAVAVAEQEVEVARQERCRIIAGMDSFEIAVGEQKVRLLAKRLCFLQVEYERNHRLLPTKSALSHHGLTLREVERVPHFEPELTP